MLSPDEARAPHATRMVGESGESAFQIATFVAKQASDDVNATCNLV